MNETEARLILQSYRPGLDDPEDPQFAEALRLAIENRELANWWEEERAFDQAMASQVAALPPPFGLKTRILAQAEAHAHAHAKAQVPAAFRFTRWMVGLAGAAAVLFLFVQVADVWRSRGAASSDLLPAYSSEMVSFVKVAPSLELMSPNLGVIMGWLRQAEAIPPDVPANLALLDPMGCRVLSFRQHDVTLVCFDRGGGKLAHLFVVERSALPGLKPGAEVVFRQEGEWMTATWTENDHAYMIAVEGDQEAAQHFLPQA